MPNYLTIGGPGFQTASGPPNNLALLPEVCHRYALEQQTPIDFWGLANSYRCPRGMEPGEAWILFARSTVDSLNLDGPATITWMSDNQTLTAQNLWFHKAICMSGGDTAEDPDSVYLCQFFDVRHLLRMTSTVGLNGSNWPNAYNIRCPQQPGTSPTQPYFPESTNSGTAWTWSGMFADLWALLPSGLAGSAPSLPATPNGTPENFRFLGMSAWEAIGVVLERLNFVLTFNPQNSTFGIQQLGSTQPGLTASTYTALLPWRRIEYFPVEGSATRLPATVRVFFNSTYQQGTVDPDVSGTSATGAILATAYSVDTASGVANAVTGTVAALWDDMCAQFNTDGSLINSSALVSRAAERTANYIDTIQTSESRQRKMYSGITTTIMPGSQIREVIWRDLGDGLCTEIFQSPADETVGAMNQGSRQGRRQGSVIAPAATGSFVNLGSRGFGEYWVGPRATQPIVHGKITGSTIMPGGSGLMNVWIYTGGSEQVTVGPIQYAVQDWLQQGFANGDYVHGYQEAASGGRWYIWKGGTSFPPANAFMQFSTGQNQSSSVILGGYASGDCTANMEIDLTAGTVTVQNSGTYFVIGSLTAVDAQAADGLGYTLPIALSQPVNLHVFQNNADCSPIIWAAGDTGGIYYTASVDILTGAANALTLDRAFDAYPVAQGSVICAANDVLALQYSCTYGSVVKNCNFSVFRIA